MKAIDVANELRKVVAALESNPEMNVTNVHVFFASCSKEQFTNLARIMPRPMQKSIAYEGQTYADFVLKYKSGPMSLRLDTPQSNTCRLVSPAIPAKYECDPVLSPEEDAEFAMETA